MLTETKLRSLKPRERIYKVSDRDGMYVAVLPSGALSFRYNYSHQGKQKTLTIGKYGTITLAEARERLIAAKKTLDAGVSPSQQKRQAKAVISVGTLNDWFMRWMQRDDLSKHSINSAKTTLKRIKQLSKKQINQISTQDIRLSIDKIKQDAPSLALVALKLVSAVFNFAIHSGIEITNPAAAIKKSAVAKITKRERALSVDELSKIFCAFDVVIGFELNKIAFELLLLTMVRKMELLEAKWVEFDFDNKTWTIPAERMKAGKQHIVYLSDHAIFLFNQIKKITFGTNYVFDVFGKNKPVNSCFLHALTKKIIEISKVDHFTVHDLRRTASTHLNTLGYNADWIEASLAHEQAGIRGIYNKADYAEQRIKMMNDWAIFIDANTKKIP